MLGSDQIRDMLSGAEMRRHVLALILAFGMAGAVNGSLAAQKTSTTLTLKDGHGQPVGTAPLSPESGGGVSIALGLKNLPPGEHALRSRPEAIRSSPVAERRWSSTPRRTT